MRHSARHIGQVLDHADGAGHTGLGSNHAPDVHALQVR